MHNTLYIDEFFLQNLLVDLLLLKVTGRVLKLRIPLGRQLLAAGAGSLAVCLIYLPGWQRGLAGKLLICAVGLEMAFLSLPKGAHSLWGKAAFLLYLNGFLLGGLFGWLRSAISFPVYPFLFFTLLSYELLNLGMKALFRQREEEQDIRSVTLRYQGREVQLRGLVDTGNRLRDPVFGRPVSILGAAGKEELLKGAEPVWYPIPYHSVGKKSGLLPAFYGDALEIRGRDGVNIRTEKPLLGVTKEPLSSKENYQMIVHPALLSEQEGGRSTGTRVGGR